MLRSVVDSSRHCCCVIGPDCPRVTDHHLGADRVVLRDGETEGLGDFQSGRGFHLEAVQLLTDLSVGSRELFRSSAGGAGVVTPRLVPAVASPAPCHSAAASTLGSFLMSSLRLI